MQTLLVPDIHGRADLCRRVLEKAGVLDAAGARVRDPEVTVVQVGNLIGGRIATRQEDAALLRDANAWFDVVLVGAHESGYFGGVPFSGFNAIGEVGKLMKDVAFRPAFAVGGTLVTHAGVAAKLGLKATCAADAVAELSEAWTLDPARHPFFSSVGPDANGPNPVGGVLWSNGCLVENEEGGFVIAEPRERRYPQAYGHSPVAQAPLIYGEPDGWFAANVFLGRSETLVALWLDGEGRPTTAIDSGLA